MCTQYTYVHNVELMALVTKHYVKSHFKKSCIGFAGYKLLYSESNLLSLNQKVLPMFFWFVKIVLFDVSTIKMNIVNTIIS